MQYILFAAFLLLFIISYYFAGKDVFSPMTVQMITFLFSSLMCVYMLPRYDYQLHGQTVALYISNLLISVLVGIVVHQAYSKVYIRRAVYSEQEVTPISNTSHFLAFGYVIAMLMWRVGFIIQLAGFGQIGQIMNTFRQLTYIADSRYGEQIIPFWLRQADHFVTALFIIYGFNFFRFGRQLAKKQKIINIVIMGLCLLFGLMAGERMNAVQNIVVFVILFHLLRIQRDGKYRVYRLKTLLRLVLLCCLILALFMGISEFVGRQKSELDVMYRLFPYTGAQIVNFDVYMNTPHAHSDMFGKYTFYNLIFSLDRIGLLNVPFYQHADTFRSIYLKGISLGNVYGMYKSYYTDFGVAGVYILNFFSALIFSVAYEYTKKRLSDRGILLFCYMYIGAVFSFFYECFYNRVLSIGYLENVIILLCFYHLLIRKKLQFGRKRILIRLSNRAGTARG